MHAKARRERARGRRLQTCHHDSRRRICLAPAPPRASALPTRQSPVQPGRDSSARPGACSITRATAPGRLLAGTSSGDQRAPSRPGRSRGTPRRRRFLQSSSRNSIGAAGSQPAEIPQKRNSWLGCITASRAERNSRRRIGRSGSTTLRQDYEPSGWSTRGLRPEPPVWRLEVVASSETIGMAASPWEWSSLAVSRAASESASCSPMQHAEMLVFLFEGMTLARDRCMTALSAL